MLVNEELTEDGEVLLLLLLPLPTEESAKPLSEAEFQKVEMLLKREEVSLSALYEYDMLQKCASETGLDEDRLRILLSHTFELNYEIQNLNEQGIWVVTVLDTDYPKAIKKRMRAKAPRVLFGIGRIENFERGGIAVLSSSNSNRSAAQFAIDTAEKIAEEHITLLSTGAKGVESQMAEKVLEKGGSAVLLVPDSLLSRSYSEGYAAAVRDGKLTLLSTSHPRAAFAPSRQTAAAEALLSLADYNLVVSSDLGRGSVFSAASAFLKKRTHAPLFAFKSVPESLGNKALESSGAVIWPQVNEMKALIPQLEAAVSPQKSNGVCYTQGELF